MSELLEEPLYKRNVDAAVAEIKLMFESSSTYVDELLFWLKHESSKSDWSEAVAYQRTIWFDAVEELIDMIDQDLLAPETIGLSYDELIGLAQRAAFYESNEINRLLKVGKTTLYAIDRLEWLDSEFFDPEKRAK